MDPYGTLKRPKARRHDGPTFLSLFSGCGGMDLGFIAAGFQCLLAIDSDIEALRVHSENTLAPVMAWDLSTGLPPTVDGLHPDVIVAGPPCQGFSTMAGVRRPDPRNRLLSVPAELATKLRPSMVVIENVPGAHRRNDSADWDRANAILRSEGYRTTVVQADSAQLGVPQLRRRLFLIGWTTNCALPELRPQPRRSTREVLEDLDEVSDHTPTPLPSGSAAEKIAKHIGPGQKLCNVRISDRAVPTWSIPEVYGRTSLAERELLVTLVKLRRRNRLRDFGDADPITARELARALGRPVRSDLQALASRGYVRSLGDRYDIVHTFNGKFRRADGKGPAPTVDTRYGDYHYFLHPFADRAFTVREAARLQSFPDWYQFSGSQRTKFRLIGNAVPPLVSYLLGGAIRPLALAGRRST